MPTAKELHINAALSNFAVKYGVGGAFAADVIAPVVPVEKESDEYHKYGREDLDDDVEDLRADGDTANEIEFSTSTDDYVAVERALRKLVTDRQMRNADKPIRPKMRATELLVHKLRLGTEKRVRDLVCADDDATPTVKWDAASGTIEIEKDIDEAKEAFVLACGMESTHILIPPDVAKVVKRNSTIRELIKYTQDDLLVNGDLPPTVFNLQVVIPGAQVNTANAGLTRSIARIWSEDKVVLVYVDPHPGIDTCTALVQFRVNSGGLGGIKVEEYRVSERGGDMIQPSMLQDEEIICAEAIRTIYNVLT